MTKSLSFHGVKAETSVSYHHCDKFNFSVCMTHVRLTFSWNTFRSLSLRLYVKRMMLPLQRWWTRSMWKKSQMSDFSYFIFFCILRTLFQANKKKIQNAEKKVKKDESGVQVQSWWLWLYCACDLRNNDVSWVWSWGAFALLMTVERWSAASPAEPPPTKADSRVSLPDEWQEHSQWKSDKSPTWTENTNILVTQEWHCD